MIRSPKPRLVVDGQEWSQLGVSTAFSSLSPECGRFTVRLGGPYLS
jgi:hypothetical protein